MSQISRTAAFAAAGVLVLGLAACSQTAASAPQPEGTLPSSADCTPEEGALRIYMNPWGTTLSDRFTEDTGIETAVADVGGGEILARIAAEANNPQWDVVLFDGHGSLQALAAQGQLLTGWPLANEGNLTAAGASLKPDDNAWVPVSEHAAAVIAYNTTAIASEDAPTSWADLTDERYAPIGMADPAVAAPAYPVASWFFEDLGSDEAEAYFGELMENGFNTYPKNGPVGQALASGEITVAALQEQNVYGLMHDGEAVDFVWPEAGAPGVIRAAAISAETPRPCAAQTLIDWMLDPETMSYLMAEGGDDGIITPFVEGTDTSTLPEERPAEAPLLITDADFAAENEADIKDWFANQLVG